MGGEDTEIDADAERGGAACGDAERLVEHRGDAAAADLVHIDDAHAQALEPLALLRLEAAHADERDMARLDHAGGEAVKRVVVLPEQPRERHAMQTPGVAGTRPIGG